MEARFKWNDDAMPSDQPMSPRRHGDAAGRRCSWTDGWDWRENGDRTLFRGGVRAWRTGQQPSVTLTAWELGAVRALTSACEASVHAWQLLLEGSNDDRIVRDRCVSNIQCLDGAAIELASLTRGTWESDGEPRPMAQKRSAVEWRESEPRVWMELLGNVARHESGLCERYASALAGSQSEQFREMLNAQATRAELGLNDVRVLMSERTRPEANIPGSVGV
jgi:hypothetical protein